MDFGSSETTNALLTLLGLFWANWGWRMDRRLTRLETQHEMHHIQEKASL